MSLTHFAYPFFSGHLGCISVLAIMNNAAIKMHVQIISSRPAFSALGLYPKVKLPHHMVTLFLIFWGTVIQFSVVAVPFYISTKSAQEFKFLHIFPLFFFFLIVTILMGVRRYLIVILICVAFPNDQWYWASFHVLIGHLYIFLGEISESFAHFWIVFGDFFWYWVLRVLYVFWICIPLSDIWFASIFSHSFYSVDSVF